MPVVSDVQARADNLEKDLRTEMEHARRCASGDYWIALMLILAAIGASIIAGLGGTASKLTAFHTGVIAFIPGAVAIIATTMKFEGKSNWHYRRFYGLQSLLSRLRYELPRTNDNIAAIARDKRVMNTAMNKEWETMLSFGLGQLTRPAHADLNWPTDADHGAVDGDGLVGWQPTLPQNGDG